MKIKPLPPLAYLNECFDLDPTSPSWLRWKLRPRDHFPTARGWAICKGRDAGREAGSIHVNQAGKTHFIVIIAGEVFFAHRVVYSLQHCRALSTRDMIDHEDNCGLNNTPGNLRLATSSENCCNTPRRRDCTSGIKGVCFCNHRGRGTWRARVMLNGKRHHVGRFQTKPMAEQAIREFRPTLHQQFCNHG